MPNPGPSDLPSLSAQIPKHLSRADAAKGLGEGEHRWAFLSLGEGAGETRVFPQQRAGQGGLLLELCRRAGPEVPDLCWVLVPGTGRPSDGKFLAGQAPGPQFE